MRKNSSYPHSGGEKMTQAGNGHKPDDTEVEVTYLPVYSPADPTEQVGWLRVSQDGEEEFILDIPISESEEPTSDN